MAKSLLRELPSWMPKTLSDYRVQKQHIIFFRKKDPARRPVCKDPEKGPAGQFVFNCFRHWGRVAWAEILPGILLPYHRICDCEPWKIVPGAIPEELFLEEFPADSFQEETTDHNDARTAPLIIA